MVTGAILGLLLAGLIGFIVGVQVEKGRLSSSTVAGIGSTTPTTAAPSGGTKAGSGGRGGRGVAGQVVSVSGNQFTVTLADGTTATVVVSGTTRYLKMVPGSQQNVVPGARVTNTGACAADGSINATVVTIATARAAGTGGRATTTLPAG
jgi:hypothetical protein